MKPEQNLKTLKDFTFYQSSEWSHKLIPKSELRREASRFINTDIDLSEFWIWCKKNKGFDYFDTDKSPLDFIKAYIEWFFNIIPEEDLK